MQRLSTSIMACSSWPWRCPRIDRCQDSRACIKKQKRLGVPGRFPGECFRGFASVFSRERSASRVKYETAQRQCPQTPKKTGRGCQAKGEARPFACQEKVRARCEEPRTK